MEIRVNGHTMKLYNEVEISLKYDAVCSNFYFALYFDPNNATHKKIFRPLTYPTCTIYHNGILVLTGTVLSHKFASAGDPPKSLVYISGYSITGILGDCSLLNFTGSLTASSSTQNVKGTTTQFDGLSLPQVAQQVCAVFPLNVVIDSELQNDQSFNKAYSSVIIDDPTAPIADFLDDLCKQKNVILSHTAKGEVLITRHKNNKLLTTSTTLVNAAITPVSSELPGATATVSKTTSQSNNRHILYDFTDPGLWLGMSFSIDGQKLHSVIHIIGERQDLDGTAVNAIDEFIFNPYVNDQSTGLFKGGVRYRNIIQTAGDDNDTPDTSRSIVGDELRSAIQLSIDVQGWTLGGHLITPNQLITVTNPELWLYNKTKFFIQEVDLHGDEKQQVATITCVVADSFGDDELNTIF